MNSFAESILIITLKTMGRVACLMPNRAALALGRVMGTVWYYVSRKKRRVCFANLKRAFGQEKSLTELRAIVRGVFSGYAEHILELLRLPRMLRSGYQDYVELVGREHIEEGLKGGKGVIFLAMHTGSWEMASMVGSMLGHPYNIVANVQHRTTRVDQILNRYRRLAGAKVIAPGLGAREIIKRLKKNEIVSLVADQGGKDGTLVPFFGTNASMSSGALRLAMSYGTAVCPVRIYRKGHARHCLEVAKPLDLVRTGDDAQDLITNLRSVVQRFEGWIREHPEEYMWFYKIWKYTDEPTAVILDDGRTGHLRQSQAAVKLLGEILAAKQKALKVTTVPVVFQSPARRTLSTVFEWLAQAFPVLRQTDWMQYFLTEVSFGELARAHADFVVSCGSGLAGVNYIMSRDQQAKSVVVLKPGILSLRSFNLVILPQHDMPARLPKGAHVVVTRVAPNLVNPDYLAEQTEALKSRFSHLKSRRGMTIGVLLGGNTKQIVFTENQAKVMIHQIKEAAHQLNASIVMTTSRRTPAEVDQLLVRELKKFENCPLIIIANRSNVPEAVGGILGLSEIVVVSGESISMISEAVSSGKKVIVFPLGDEDHPRLKFRNFVDRLNEQGYLVSCGTKGISQAIYNVARNKIHTRPVDDREELLKAIREVV